MRQIAVLPYRFAGVGKDGPTEIMLITSRGTGRWVIPKGNPLTGMDRHASAAVEAEELIGICDRILVLRRGRIAGEFTRANFNREEILRAALGAEPVTA